MIKYYVAFLAGAVRVDGEEVFPARFLGWYADKRIFVAAHKRLYVTTWNDLEEAKEEARKLREEFPDYAENIMVDSYVSYTEGEKA